MKTVFVGTPEFGAIILEGLAKSVYKPVLVITATDKPAGRKQVITPPPVKVLAEKLGIKVLQPEKISDLKSELSLLKPDMIIVAAFGQIIPKEILDIPKYGCLNIHPSLLPKYRGASPIQSVILNGEKVTGVTIILMDEKMDHGQIVSQRSMAIEEKERARALHDKLAELSLNLLLETISNMERGLTKLTPQDHNQATFTKTLSKAEGIINWKKPADMIEREIRAFEYWPGSFTFWTKLSTPLRLKITKAKALKSMKGIDFRTGQVFVVPKGGIGVQCGEDFLVIERLQLEGKEEMGSEEFLRGHPSFIGAVLK
ncbi:MAG: methionyl-tRNA formyltransferase [Candidatus Paceibacterota bacterium]